MNETIIQAIDAELGRLQQARALLVGTTSAPAKRGPGRPKKTAAPMKKATKQAGKRTMSAEARERIRQAQIKRWAKNKK